MNPRIHKDIAKNVRFANLTVEKNNFFTSLLRFAELLLTDRHANQNPSCDPLCRRNDECLNLSAQCFILVSCINMTSKWMLVLNRIIPLQHASVCETERTGDICLSFSSVFFYWFRNLGRRMVLGTHPSIIQAILKPAKRPPQCVLGLPLGLLPDTHAWNT